MLTLVVFAVGVVRSFFTPERTRRILAGTHESVGNVLAALLGVVTPFCSCSAVPLFIGFVTTGVPLGVTFSFLVAAPMVNEVALVLLFGLFGWKVAAVYMGTGLAIAMTSGWVIGRLRMERHVEPWVYEMKAGRRRRRREPDGLGRPCALRPRRRPRDRRQGLAVRPGRDRGRRRHPRLGADQLHGVVHGQGRVVGRAASPC